MDSPHNSDYYVELAKNMVDSTKEAVEKADEWVKDADQLAKAEKNLSGFQDAIKGVEAFGKASTVLGVASVGLDIALMFSSELKTEEVTIDMLNEISHKIDELSSHMDARFDEIILQLKLIDAWAAVRPHLDRTRQLFGAINDYRNPDLETDRETIGKQIVAAYLPANLRGHADSIVTSCVGAEGTPNLLQLINDQTHGDLHTVVAVGTSLLNSVMHLAMGETLIETLIRKQQLAEGKEVDFLSPESVQTLYQPRIDKIKAALDEQVKDCVDKAIDNMKKILPNEIINLEAIPSLIDPLEKLGLRLQEQWFWLDWMLLVDNRIDHFVTNQQYLIFPWEAANSEILVTWDAARKNDFYNAFGGLVDMFVQFIRQIRVVNSVSDELRIIDIPQEQVDAWENKQVPGAPEGGWLLPERYFVWVPFIDEFRQRVAVWATRVDRLIFSEIDIPFRSINSLFGPDTVYSLVDTGPNENVVFSDGLELTGDNRGVPFYVILSFSELGDLIWEGDWRGPPPTGA